MKKVVFALTCIATLTMMVACGNNPKKGKEAQEEKQEVAAATRIVCSEVNVDNFAEAIRTNAGVDFKVPDGWKVVSANGTESGFGGRTIVVNFGKQDNAVEVARAFFEQTKVQTRPFYEQKKETAAESYVKTWSAFLDSNLEDHDWQAQGFWWKYLVAPFKENTVYFYTDPVEIKFELPKVE